MERFTDWTPAALGRPPYLPGQSPFERLPNELLFKILELLMPQYPAAASTPRDWFMSQALPSPINDSQPIASLSPCLRVTRRLHNIALPLFYRDIKLAQSQSEKLQNLHVFSIPLDSSLACLVRNVDLTNVLDSGLYSLLPRALTLLPRLRTLHLQLFQTKQLDDRDIQNIFFGMPGLETLSLENTCRDTHPDYLSDVLRALVPVDMAISSNIRSLTFRCGRVPFPGDRLPFVDEYISRGILQRFPKLHSLDLANTPINPKSLRAINQDVKLRFLRINTCQDNDTSALAHFLSTHPSIQSSLVVFDGSGIRFTKQETTTILEHLPSSLRSLNLSSSTMVSDHVPQLQKLCRHIEEFSVGRGFTMDDMEAMILRPLFNFSPAVPRSSLDWPRSLKDKPGHELALGPMRDAIAVCKLHRRLASVSEIHGRESASGSKVEFLNISSLDEEEQDRITNSVLLGEHSRPLKTIVASKFNTENLQVLRKLHGGCEWRENWCNGMSWIEKE